MQPLTLSNKDDLAWIIMQYGYLLPKDDQWRTGSEFADLIANTHSRGDPHNAQAAAALRNPARPHSFLRKNSGTIVVKT